MQLFQKFSFPTLVNFIISFFFLSVLTFKGGHNIAPTMLIICGMGYFIYAKKQNLKFYLNKQDKYFIFSLFFYFSTFILSLIFNGGKMRELDIPSRAILLIPALLMLFHIPVKLCALIYAIPLGSFITGIIALIDKFLLNQPIAFAIRTMHIQAGDIAMSLAMFSLLIAFYAWQNRNKKIVILILFCSAFGILGSVLSTARGGWIGVPVILFAIFILRGEQISRRFAMGSAIIFMLIISVLAQTEVVKNRVQNTQDDIIQYLNHNSNTSLGLRFEMWKSAALMIEQQPIFGVGEMGANQLRQLHSQEKIVNGDISGFTHAHNQYLDNFSKRGIINLIAFLFILLIPLLFFIKNSKSSQTDIKLLSNIGVIHILSILFYNLSQGFFTHHSGNIFYLFLTFVLYGMIRQRQLQLKN